MSSTNKTVNLELNSWRGSDVPEMDDFNRDNIIIDNAFGLHTGNNDIHVTAADKAKWNNAYSLFTYTGNGNTSRTVTVTGVNNPRWGIVFAVNKTPDVTDFSNTADYNYFGLVSDSGSTQGLNLSGNTLTVSQSPSPVLGKEYRSFNEVSTVYVCIMFA